MKVNTSNPESLDPDELDREAEDGRSRHFTIPRPAGYDRLFGTDLQPPPVLIDGFLPREAFGLVGPGGTAKTTLTLWIMVHVVLGRDVFGRKIKGPGPCLFVSAEDPLGTVLYRLRQICDALDLSEEEQLIVSERINIEDVTGKLVRFVEADQKGNLRITEAVSHLIEAYHAADIQLCVMDPATFFGPGERFVNDAEAALMQAARRISKGLECAAVGYLHHVGKSAARENTTDQYAGRGGSAFADNSRALLVLNIHTTDLDDAPRPEGVTHEDVEDGRAIRLHVGKFSAGPREKYPVWIVRGKDNPWKFTAYETEILDSEKKAERERQAKERFDYAALTTIRRFLKENASKYPTKTMVCEHCDVYVGSGKVGKNRVTEIINRAIFRGEIKEKEIPKEHRERNKKSYLVAVWPTSPIREGG